MKLTHPMSLDLVICTYNKAFLLDRALGAIAEQVEQPLLDWGCLIIDNTCTDNTSKIVEKHIKSGRIPNIRVKVEKQQGLTPARLCGFKNSHRDWLAFIDDDCILNKNWLLEAGRFLKTHPPCGAFGGQVILDYEVNPPVYLLQYGYSYAEQNLGAHLIETDFLVGAGLVVSKIALIRSGWTNKQLLRDRIGNKLTSGGDVEMVLRIRSAGYKLWYVPDCKLRHTIPQQRMSKKYLININFNLGISQSFADAMVWPGSYLSWRNTALHNLTKSWPYLYKLVYRMTFRKQSIMDLAVKLSFISGQYAGFCKLLKMNDGIYNDLLGCAP